MNFFKNIVKEMSSKVKNKKHISENNRKKSYLNFIPHACHGDQNTIINKNGELIQIIKLEDRLFNFNNNKDIREKIRNSLIKNIKTPNISLWIYTVKKPITFNLEWKKTGDFSDDLNKIKNENINSNAIYINEIYIAFVTDKLRENISSIIPSLAFSYVKKRHKEFLKNKMTDLNTVVDNVLADLKEFQVKKLGVIETDDKRYRSELIEFFYYLMTFKDSEFFLDDRNISNVLADCKIEMGFHLFKSTSNNSANFGSIIGIKEYINAPLEALDICLQLNYEFIVIEILRFVKTKEAISSFIKTGNLLQASQDNLLLQKSNLNEIISRNKNHYLDFCEHKINFLIISDKISKIGKNITNMINALSTMGVVPILYDIHMEDNFWSHFPGNFTTVINTRHNLFKYALTFATFHSFSSGPLKGTRWNEAITIFFSNKKEPYFFNFHVSNKGHTVVLGSPKSGRTLLINFILSESRRLNTKLIIFDHSGKSIIFIKAINGEYHKIDSRAEHKGLSFNPLKLEDTEKNRKLLKGFFQRIVYDINESKDIIINKIIDYIFTLPMESRTFSTIGSLLKNLEGEIEKWLNNGEFSHLIAEETSNELDWNEKILGINIGFLTHNSNCFAAIMYYILNHIENYLDGSPTILVLDEAWKIHTVFPIEKEFDEWMERMSQLNVVVIFTTENITNAAASEFTSYLTKHVDTRIFMPNFLLNKLYMQSFSLSKEEFNTMLQVPTHSRNFFIKQDNLSAVLTLNLHKKREVNVLSANKNTVKYMYESINTKGDNPHNWLPLFYEKCQN